MAVKIGHASISENGTIRPGRLLHDQRTASIMDRPYGNAARILLRSAKYSQAPS